MRRGSRAVGADRLFVDAESVDAGVLEGLCLTTPQPPQGLRFSGVAWSQSV